MTIEEVRAARIKTQDDIAAQVSEIIKNELAKFYQRTGIGIDDFSLSLIDVTTHGDPYQFFRAQCSITIRA